MAVSENDEEGKMQQYGIEKDARDVEYLILQLPLDDAVLDYAAAVRKRQQLEREILLTTTTGSAACTNLQHSLSKLWMYLSEFVPATVKERYAEHNCGK
jgi:hypothetical protein